MSNPTTSVTRSGDLYLVQVGDIGRLVDLESGEVYPPARVTSILAHSSVSVPWRQVAPADVPQQVRRAGEALPRSLPEPE